jgi:hypothetical protein
VSDPRQVPPTPGTQPRVSRQRLRPYREDAGIYARHREAGTHPYTEGEVEARIVANAADAAAGEGTGPLDVPFLRELVALFRYRIYRGLPLTAEQRAERDRTWFQARAELAAAQRERAQHEGSERELKSLRQRMPRPVGGATFTRPEWLLAGLLAAMAIEILGSVPALKAAFELEVGEAWIFAGSISVILILAADQLGNTLASMSRESRRWTKAIAAFLVVVAVGAGIWAIVMLADSRAANTSFGAAGEREAEVGKVDLSAARGRKTPQEAVATGAKTARQSLTGNEPDIGFFIPLSILIIATSTLLAFRVEGAADWNDINDAIGGAEEALAKARAQEAEKQTAYEQAVVPETEAILELAAYVEREHGLLQLWIERFSAEYGRFCAAEGREPRELVVLAVPTPGEVLEELLRPPGDPGPQGPRRPERDPGQAGRSDGPRGPGPRGPGPEQPPGPPPQPAPEPPQRPTPDSSTSPRAAAPATGTAPRSDAGPGDPDPAPPRSRRGRRRSPGGQPPGTPGDGPQG